MISLFSHLYLRAVEACVDKERRRYAVPSLPFHLAPSSARLFSLQLTPGITPNALHPPLADEGNFTLTSLHFFLLPLACTVSLAQHLTGNWILNNLVALSFSFNAIGLLGIDSFMTGSILLAGLFLYDVWCASFRFFTSSSSLPLPPS